MERIHLSLGEILVIGETELQSHENELINCGNEL